MVVCALAETLRDTAYRRMVQAVSVMAAALFAASAGSCAAEPTPQPAKTAGWIGANYTPAYAANQIQFWHEFKPEVIEKELAAARRYFAINTLRVYLHYINYRDDRKNFLANIEKFLVICDRAGIKPGFVFFDDCWNHAGISLKTEPAVPGRHNGRWAAVQDIDRKDENLPLFESYVSNIVSRYRTDSRVHWWEVYNEPKREDRFTELLCQKGYYIGFGVDKLYLGKMNNNWQELATCDLTKLACKVEPDVWNRLRVSIKGNHIKVWFNPLHSDPGLRIEYTDDKEPVLKGKIGIRSSAVLAWVDNVVVLPLDNL